MSNVLVVNMFGGPGSGKSTTATGVFSGLKLAGVNAEYVSEYAKDLVWSERSLRNQLLILGKQYDRMLRLKDKVEVIVTDSPLLLTALYNEGHQSISQAAKDVYSEFWNLNFVIQRAKPYNPAGRYQTEDEARALDLRTRQLLASHELAYESVPGTAAGIEHAFNRVLIELTRGKMLRDLTEAAESAQAGPGELELQAGSPPAVCLPTADR